MIQNANVLPILLFLLCPSLFLFTCFFQCKNLLFLSLQFSSVTQSSLTLCDPMDCSTPGLPVHHQLPDLAIFLCNPCSKTHTLPFFFASPKSVSVSTNIPSLYNQKLLQPHFIPYSCLVPAQCLFKKKFIVVQLICNIVLISGEEQSESVIHTHIFTLFQILFPYKPLQSGVPCAIQ